MAQGSIMLIPNLLALTLLLLKVIKGSLLAFSPSLPELNSEITTTILGYSDNSPLLKTQHPPYLQKVDQGLTLTLGVYLAIQVQRGLLPLPLIIFALFIGLLLLLACFDWFYLILPNSLNFLLIILGLSTSITLFGHGLIDVLVRCSCCYGTLWWVQALYQALRHRPGLGLGDVKYLTALASWFTIEQLCTLILLASLTALTFYLCKHRDLNSLNSITIPYGSFLSVSAMYCAYLFFPDLLDIY